MNPLKKRDIGGPYDDAYARSYDSIWWEHEHWQSEGAFHVETISKLINPQGKWLDAGCGSGYFLSKFPDFARSGLDYSESMIKEAERNNPGVTFFHQSLTDRNEALEGQFDLVTCTGQPWSYLATLDEQEIAVGNLASWTSSEGSCLLSQIDLSDIVKIDNLPCFYQEETLPLGNSKILGVYWLHKDIKGTYHYCLSPNMDQWIRWFSVYFKRIEVVYGPHEPAYIPIPRRLLICSEKRKPGDQLPATIVGQPVPMQVTQIYNNVSSLSNRQLVGELSNRVKSGALLRSVFRRFFGSKG